ncbi:MAG: hypothetical protein L3K18_03160 [Thermoplasmata archaeon]|nr:hypothetical protein [Thermoplasmata archaeon]MCI4356131.1 hypothetical protein [Thermoplasmata archaeon]
MAGMNPAAQNIVNSLQGQPMLLMKMQILSLGKNYWVMDKEQKPLCYIGLDAAQNVSGALLGSAVSSLAGDYVGRYVQRSQQYTYTVKDQSQQVAMLIKKGSGGNKTQFNVVDAATGGSFGVIDMKRSLIGGLKATWLAPNGAPMMSTKGNIIRRKYSIVGPDGREVGRVRHKILAIRDVWQLEFESGANHLYSAIFATVLDFEKKM